MEDDETDEDRDDSIAGALERVLSHAESHGEAYEGATEDHATLRAALADRNLPADPDQLTTDDVEDPPTWPTGVSANATEGVQ